MLNSIYPHYLNQITLDINPNVKILSISSNEKNLNLKTFH